MEVMERLSEDSLLCWGNNRGNTGHVSYYVGQIEVGGLGVR